MARRLCCALDCDNKFAFQRNSAISEHGSKLLQVTADTLFVQLRQFATEECIPLGPMGSDQVINSIADSMF